VTVLASRESNGEAGVRSEGAAPSPNAALLRVSVAPPNSREPLSSADLSSGAWRGHHFASDENWPASWTSTERRKLLSPDGRSLLKFEGLGRSGKAVMMRARAIADAGFGPEPLDSGDGFAAYDWVAGRPMTKDDLDARMLRRLAAYCAERPTICPVGQSTTPSQVELESMVATNLERAFGTRRKMSLRVERPTIADGRMMPHEWLVSPEGISLKADGAAHGDDHFFPGPTDVAWDLAGAIVEWGMTGATREAFLHAYHPRIRRGSRRANRRLDDRICRVSSRVLHRRARELLGHGRSRASLPGARAVSHARAARGGRRHGSIVVLPSPGE